MIRTNARRREKGSKLLSTKFLVMFFIERKSEICKVQLKMVTLCKNKSRIPHRSDTNSSKANREPVKSSMIKFNHFVGKSICITQTDIADELEQKYGSIRCF